MIRKKGFPTTVKTFRTKRDAEDWARRTEDEMVRGIYIQRAPAEKMTFSAALDRYLSEVTPTKRPKTQQAERTRATPLKAFFGKYSLATISAELVAEYRDKRLAGEDRLDKDGNPRPRSASTVRLEMALLGHLFTTAIKEWGIGLTYNPVTNVRRPAPGAGRNRRISSEEEQRLLSAVDAHSNPIAWLDRPNRHRDRYALLRDHIPDTGPGQSEKAHRYAAGNQEHHAPNSPSYIGCRGTVSAGHRQPCSSTRHKSCLFWRAWPGRHTQALQLQQGLDAHQEKCRTRRPTLS